jgi:DNA-binding CsgD family transcriptional regulator
LVLAYLGEIDEASVSLDRLLASDDQLIVGFAQLPACIVDLARLDSTSAWKRLERLRVVHSLGVAEFTLGVLAARARWYFQAGDYTRALDTVAEADVVSGDLFDPSRLELFVTAIRSARAVGDEEVAKAVQARLDELVALGGGRAVRAASAWAKGLAAAAGGSPVDALPQLLSAAQEYERSARLAHAAEVWCDLVEVAAHADDSSLRTQALNRATEIATSRGLTFVLARLDEQRRSFGDSAGGAAHDLENRIAALAALSSREREITQLVVEGKTNRQIASALFISEHTVRNQLVNVFAKLGVSRRAQLVHLVLSGGPADRKRSGQRDAP